MINSKTFQNMDHLSAYKICEALIDSEDWNSKNACINNIFIAGNISTDSCKHSIELAYANHDDILSILCALMCNIGLGFRLLLLRQSKFTGIPNIGNKRYIGSEKEERIIAREHKRYHF